MKYTTEQIEELIETNNTHAFYVGYDWIKLTQEVRKEQHNECQKCKANGRYKPAEIVHHVRYLKKYPELAYSKFYYTADGTKHMQLMCLCDSCHKEVHSHDVKKNKNKYRFYNEEKW